jgi:hypothetical protein
MKPWPTVHKTSLTPGMLSRLADAEQEALEDMDHWPDASGDTSENTLFRRIV